MRKIKFRNILKSIYQEPEKWGCDGVSFLMDYDEDKKFFILYGFKGYVFTKNDKEYDLTFWQKVRFHIAFKKWQKAEF